MCRLLVSVSRIRRINGGLLCIPKSPSWRLWGVNRYPSFIFPFPAHSPCPSGLIWWKSFKSVREHPLCLPSSAQIILMNLDECVFDCHQPSPIKVFNYLFSHYAIEISFSLWKYFLFSLLISERVVSLCCSYRIIINHCTSKTDYVNFLCYLARTVITSSLYAGYSRWISSTTLTNCN